MSNKVVLTMVGLLIMSMSLILNCEKKNSGVITGSGSLEATEITVRARTAGQVLEMAVNEGSAIEAGSVIAVVDTEKISLQMKQVQAGLSEVDFVIRTADESTVLAEEQLANVRKKYERIKALFGQGSATQQQMDDISTQHNLAETQARQAKSGLRASQMKRLQIEANLDLLESQLRDCSVKSPAVGTVIKKYIEQGETVTPGMAVVDIADLSRMWIKLYITAPELGFVTLNEDATIEVDSFAGRKFTGKVVWISPKAEFTPKNVQTKEARADLVYAVKIELANPDNELKIGMPADIVVNK
ncbi:MAG: HlyD family secretion protein [Candidatus Zhuqueibacterota bacterium]